MTKKDLSISQHFADLPDPRLDRTKKHSLNDILVIALSAVICGADSWEEAPEEAVRFGLDLPAGTGASADAMIRSPSQ